MALKVFYSEQYALGDKSESDRAKAKSVATRLREMARRLPGKDKMFNPQKLKPVDNDYKTWLAGVKDLADAVRRACEKEMNELQQKTYNVRKSEFDKRSREGGGAYSAKAPRLVFFRGVTARQQYDHWSKVSSQTKSDMTNQSTIQFGKRSRSESPSTCQGGLVNSVMQLFNRGSADE